MGKGINIFQLTKKINQEQSVIAKFNKIIWDRQVLNKTRLQIYESLVESVKVYDEKFWNSNAKLKLRVLSTNFLKVNCILTITIIIQNK